MPCYSMVKGSRVTKDKNYEYGGQVVDTFDLKPPDTLLYIIYIKYQSLNTSTL